MMMLLTDLRKAKQSVDFIEGYFVFTGFCMIYSILLGNYPLLKRSFMNRECSVLPGKYNQYKISKSNSFRRS
jgi:TRAP-type mannitol/chloroaromatic compound transport system permease small subunit